jgi:hypothetical protein
MPMSLNVEREVAALQRLSAAQLCLRYTEVFGEATNANNKTWLIKRIAWRLQAQAEGDLSERARQRAAELANDADLRMSPPGTAATLPLASDAEPQARTLKFQTDGRLPLPGTIITRKYKGQILHVQVLRDGFEFDGQVYGSLSAVARAITGSHCNGFLFFLVGQYGGER